MQRCEEESFNNMYRLYLRVLIPLRRRISDYTRSYDDAFRKDLNLVLELKKKTEVVERKRMWRYRTDR